MDCRRVEDQLSEYMERSLPATEMGQVAEHLDECRSCAALLEEMRFALAACQSFPKLEMDLDLVERILLRTSGRPRTRTFRELLSQYFLRPMLTPRFAAGAVLATLFMVLLMNLMLPHVPAVASALSPTELFRRMDRGVQQLYGEGLKAYDKKTYWQAQFTFIKNGVFNKLGFMIEQLDVPVEGKKKSDEPRQQQEKTPNEKSSLLLLPA